MNINNAVRKNSFAMYFKCDNTVNCFVIAKNNSELSNSIEDGAYFIPKEIDGKRVKITIGDKDYIVENCLRSVQDAKGINHWMAPLDATPQLVNLLP